MGMPSSSLSTPGGCGSVRRHGSGKTRTQAVAPRIDPQPAPRFSLLGRAAACIGVVAGEHRRKFAGWKRPVGAHGGGGGLRRPSHASRWHDCGMRRIRLSTTVDGDLLEAARKASGKPDSALVDEALAALVARHRAAEVDASYVAYEEHPLDEPDAWGDLASFRRAVAAS